MSGLGFSGLEFRLLDAAHRLRNIARARERLLVVLSLVCVASSKRDLVQKQKRPSTEDLGFRHHLRERLFIGAEFSVGCRVYCRV